MEHLVVIGGIGTNKYSYQKLKQDPPEGWEVEVAGPADLMPNGQLSEASGNILHILNDRSFTQINLLGHSLGGIVALYFASQQPDKVKHLFLIDSEGINGEENWLKALYNFFKDNLTADVQAISGRREALKQIMSKPLLYWRLARLAQYGDVEIFAQLTTVPTTILWGEKDYLIPYWQGEKLHQLIPDSKLIVLKGLDHHWIHYSPEKFWEQII